jgi:hypothetical protein
MPWGKYKGEPLDSLPDWYLGWVATEFSVKAIRRAAIEELNRRQQKDKEWQEFLAQCRVEVVELSALLEQHYGCDPDDCEVAAKRLDLLERLGILRQALMDAECLV